MAELHGESIGVSFDNQMDTYFFPYHWRHLFSCLDANVIGEIYNQHEVAKIEFSCREDVNRVIQLLPLIVMPKITSIKVRDVPHCLEPTNQSNEKKKQILLVAMIGAELVNVFSAMPVTMTR
jgi:hypothetical protein